MIFILLMLLVAVTCAENEYRLPQTVLPENYKLRILTHLGPEEENFKFSGEVKIELICVHPTVNITLHSKGLQIQENTIKLHDISSKTITNPIISGVEYNNKTDFFTIKLAGSLRKDHKYVLRIEFTGQLTDSLFGFYRSRYLDLQTKQIRWLAVTQFQPTHARKAFPCFDEPAMKATFEVSLGRQGMYRTLSNMPQKGTQAIQEMNGWFWDHYEKSVKMSSYLVAFLVFDDTFKEADLTENGVAFKFWTKRDAIHQVEFAKEISPKSLNYFEKFFNIKYPLAKLDMVAVPNFFAGGMENWGLITYHELALLYDPKQSNKNIQSAITFTICHEVAHQWFGNLVTMKWWSDLWLNEGFASYMASLGIDHLFPEWNYLQKEVLREMLSVYQLDALKNSHPISVDVENPDEIEEKFDGITYGKGFIIIRMMGVFLGKAALQKGVSNYLKKHEYNNAEQDDLWQSLTKQAHSDGVLAKELSVKTIMDTWTLQAGYPVVTVKRNYKDNSAEISQERFLSNRAQMSQDEKCWWVPLTFTSKSESNFTVTRPKQWLQCPQRKQTIKNLPSDDEWVIFNIGMSGMYRVNYDERNWNLLVETLKSSSYKKIPVLNRVQLIIDAADLAWVGQLDYGVFFNLFEYMQREDEYQLWESALASTNHLDQILSRTSRFGQFKTFMKKQLTPIYKKLGGFSINASTPFDTINFQVLITSNSCGYGVENCANEAVELFRKYRQNPESQNIIPDEMAGIICCRGIRSGNESDWEFLWEQYEKSDAALDKFTILGVLSCTNNVWLLKRYLDWSLNNPSLTTNIEYTLQVFKSVASSVVGSYVAAEFFFNNFHKIYNHILPNTIYLAQYLCAVASGMTTERELKELENFVKSDENKGIFAQIKQSVDQALEKIQIRIDWRKNHEEYVAALLDYYGGKDGQLVTVVDFSDTYDL